MVIQAVADHRPHMLQILFVLEIWILKLQLLIPLQQDGLKLTIQVKTLKWLYCIRDWYIDISLAIVKKMGLPKGLLE